MATRHVLADLAAAAVAAGLPALEIESVGGVDAKKRVAAGEAFDLVFLAADALDALAAEGRVKPPRPLVLSQVAVAVPAPGVAAAERPPGTAFADIEGVRAALREATRIGYSTGPSGTALVRMIDDWGLTGEIGDRLVQARPGVPVARSLADGDVDLGFQQLSELVGQPGIRILGTLPAEAAIDTIFAGAVATASSEGAAAGSILAFFASDEVAQIKSRHSFAAV